MKLLTLVSLVILLGIASCRSAEKAEFTCICGTPDAALSGCLHPLCMSGENNPDNPECACGTLSFGE